MHVQDKQDTFMKQRSNRKDKQRSLGNENFCIKTSVLGKLSFSSTFLIYSVQWFLSFAADLHKMIGFSWVQRQRERSEWGSFLIGERIEKLSNEKLEKWVERICGKVLMKYSNSNAIDAHWNGGLRGTFYNLIWLKGFRFRFTEIA